MQERKGGGVKVACRRVKYGEDCGECAGGQKMEHARVFRDFLASSPGPADE